MDVKNIKRIYFIGIGGIGMSALARFFSRQGAVVKGYDRTPSDLTTHLESEGMDIHYADDVDLLDKNAELIVYTPAIQKDHRELNWYNNNGYQVYKRSDVLQWITQAMFAVTVAGTHGKTTISTMTAYLLRETGFGCNAFLGGISVNYESNYWSSDRDVAVIEADEYDRSFLKLHPDIAVLTAMDADHLDIYGTVEEMEEAFLQYTRNIKDGGTLLVKYGLHRAADIKAPHIITYSLHDKHADVHATHIAPMNGGYVFNIKGIDWMMQNVELPIGGTHNIENAVAAITVTHLLGISGDAVVKALKRFRGVRRRFEYIVNTPAHVYIDDYAHHPEELATLIQSAKYLFPGRRCVIAFQPHLYSRTRDLADGFAQSLDMADEVLLLDIYPAREQPMEGVTSQMITTRMKNINHRIVSKETLQQYVAKEMPALFITAGAGDIDHLIQPIKNILS
jgi:UDP-N-acetylmuramate--alanine ligase